MAPLIAKLNTSISQSTRPSVASSNFRMPHVFVIPPEEEQQDNPPWCFFDANEQPEDNGDFPSNPDIHFLDVPYLFQQSERDTPALLARHTSAHHSRPRVPMSKKLEKKQRPEPIRIVESKSSQERRRDAREDSDVVEVVKVKRGREPIVDPEENTKAKRSKTLKARATKALQSIKNVNKASHRTHVKELWTPSRTMPGILKGAQEQTRPQQNKTEDRPPSASFKKGYLSRGNSQSLSQVFQLVKPSRVTSSFAIRVPAAPIEAHSILPTANSSPFPHIRYTTTNLSLNEIASTLTTDDALHRPAPLIPPMKKTANTRFSVRELHRLFTFSLSSDDPSSPTATGAPCSSAHSHSKPSTSTPTLSHNFPDVPMEEDIYADVHFSDLGSADQKLASEYHQVFHTPPAPRRLSDLSFEMRLDSLHFDPLSFEPEAFYMEGNVLR